MHAIQLQGSVRLKPSREQSLLRFHPWVFSGAIQEQPPELPDGCWVSVTDHRGKNLGFGHFQQGSISIRILHFGETLDPALYIYKVQAAVRLRLDLGMLNDKTNCCRLVHGEGDGLPGLVIDLYDKVAVVQAHSHGMNADRERIAEALNSVLRERITAIWFRDTFSGQGQYLSGSAMVPGEVLENGNKFLVDWVQGQKTGFFLDQRDNRQLLSTYCNGKQVLNTFAYTGGFSVYALRGGATLVHSVDASASASAMCAKNIRLNGFDPDLHRSVAMDTFEFLKKAETQYDVIILDPPAFAKHKDSRHQAMKGYQRLNAEALKVIRSGGILFTFSCSQVVDRQLFYDTVMSSAIQAGRDARVIGHLSQPGDHPVSAFHPEGAYLKGLVLYIA